MSSTNVSVKIKNYKCFRDEFAGFDHIKPVNIIIGRNNSGKSTLLDLLTFASGTQKETNFTIQYQDNITENELRSVFRKNVSDGALGGNHWDFHGKCLDGLKMSYEINNGNMMDHQWLNPELFGKNANINRHSHSEDHVIKNRQNHLDEYIARQGSRIPLFFKKKIIRKLSAERDIRKEAYNGLGSDKISSLNHTGENATEIVCTFINDSQLDRNVIQRGLLSALNTIYFPDNCYKEIVVRHHNTENSWEIFLLKTIKGLYL